MHIFRSFQFMFGVCRVYESVYFWSHNGREKKRGPGKHTLICLSIEIRAENEQQKRISINKQKQCRINKTRTTFGSFFIFLHFRSLKWVKEESELRIWFLLHVHCAYHAAQILRQKAPRVLESNKRRLKRPTRPTHAKPNHTQEQNFERENKNTTAVATTRREHTQNRLCCYKNLVNVCELKFKMAEFRCMEYFISHVYGSSHDDQLN